MKIKKSELIKIISEELDAMLPGEEISPAPEDHGVIKRMRDEVRKAYIDDGRVLSKKTDKPLKGMQLRRWIQALTVTQGEDHKGSIGQRTAEDDLPPSLSYAQEEEDAWSKAYARDRKVKDRDYPLE